LSSADFVSADRLRFFALTISPDDGLPEEALFCFRAWEAVFFRIVLLDQLEIR